MINILNELIEQKEEELFKAKSEEKDLQNKMSDPSTLDKIASSIKHIEDIRDMLENLKSSTEGQQSDNFEDIVDSYQEYLKQEYATVTRKTVESEGIEYEWNLWILFKADILKQYKDIETRNSAQ